MNCRKYLYRCSRKNRKSQTQKDKVSNNSIILKVSTAAVSCALAVTMNSSPLQAELKFEPQTPLYGVKGQVPTFVDIDKDNDFDAVIVGDFADGYVGYFENIGNNDKPLFKRIYDSPFNGHSFDYNIGTIPEFADLDGDSDLDAIFGERKWGNTDQIHYLRNDTTSDGINFVKLTGIENPFEDLYSDPTDDNIDLRSISLVDINNDTKYDMFIGEYKDDPGDPIKSRIRYFKNNGDNTFTEKSGDENPLNAVILDDYFNVSFADIDSDGDLDAFIGNYNSLNGESNIQFYKNIGTVENPEFENHPEMNPYKDLNVGTRPNPAFVDIDSDNDLDAFLGQYEEGIIFYKNTGDNIKTVFSEPDENPFHNVDVGYSSKPIFVDIDNDKDFDTFIGSSDGEIYYYENIGTKSNPLYQLVTGPENPVWDFIQTNDLYRLAPSFADIDGDNDFDGFIGAEDGTIYFLENRGNSGTPDLVQDTVNNPFKDIDVDFYSVPTFADITGDSRLEAIIGEDDGYGEIYVYNEANDPPYTYEIRKFYNSEYRKAPFLVDIDNDNDFDVFIGDDDGKIEYYKNTGSSDFDTMWVKQTGTDNPFDGIDFYDEVAPVFVDIDNDTDYDAFIGSDDGKVHFYKNINEPPSDLSLTLTADIVDEQDAGVTLGDLGAIDLDAADNNNHIYRLAPGTGDTFNSYFEIEGINLKTAATIDREEMLDLVSGTGSIRIRAIDSGGGYKEKTFLIDITDINDNPPTALNISPSPTLIEVGVQPGFEVAEFETEDRDTFQHEYELAAGDGDDHNSYFSINGNKLVIENTMDMTDLSLSIRVRSTDPEPVFYAEESAIEQTFTLELTEDKWPTDITISNYNIDENQLPGSVIGVFSTADETPGDVFTYELASNDGDNSLFTIEGDELKAIESFDYEVKNIYSISVNSTDLNGNSIEDVNITININDQPEEPVDIALSRNRISENKPSGTEIGSFSTTDQDAGDTHNYSIINDIDTDDYSAFTIDGDTLKSAISFDYETTRSYDLKVRSSDSDGMYFEKVFTISIRNVTEPGEEPPEEPETPVEEEQAQPKSKKKDSGGCGLSAATQEYETSGFSFILSNIFSVMTTMFMPLAAVFARRFFRRKEDK